jgi:hypothetical protein
VRIAARSTSSGTPVKSCSSTRATMNGISSVRSARRQLRERADVVLGDLLSVDVAEDGLENDADAHRQLRDAGRCRPARASERVELSAFAVAEVEGVEARSGTDSERTPAPKNSTNLPTTFALRSISVTVSTRSVAVTPSRSTP